MVDDLAALVATATKPLWLRALPYLVALAGFTAVCIGCYSTGVDREHQARVAEVAQLNERHQATLHQVDTEHRTQLQAATDKVLATERKAAEDMAALDRQRLKELTDAKNRAAADVAAVRAGAWSVRDEFTCAASAAGPGGDVPTAGASAGVGHGAAQRGLGAEDAAAILEAADTGDHWAIQLKACQAIVTRDRASGSGPLQP